MRKFTTIAIAALTLACASAAPAAEQMSSPAPVVPTEKARSVLDGQLRLAQTATCIYNGKRYNKGARLCIGGYYNYCNSRGLWEPSNLTC